jgi:flagellar hook-basal body complex protein FliE
MDLVNINTQIASAVAKAKDANELTGLSGAGLLGTHGTQGSAGFDFASTLDAALKSVSQTQAESGELQKQFQLENPNVSLEQTVVAMNISSISFAAAVQVRNRLVQAYDQVMNMQV